MFPPEPMRRLVGLAALISTCFMLASIAHAQTSPSETLGPLAADLTATLEKAFEAARSAELQDTAIRQRMRDAALETMKNVRTIAADYEKRVLRSRSISETELFFESVRQGVDSARTIARDAVPDPEVAKHLDRLTVILARLADIYDAAH